MEFSRCRVDFILYDLEIGNRQSYIQDIRNFMWHHMPKAKHDWVEDLQGDQKQNQLWFWIIFLSFQATNLISFSTLMNDKSKFLKLTNQPCIKEWRTWWQFKGYSAHFGPLDIAMLDIGLQLLTITLLLYVVSHLQHRTVSAWHNTK